MAIGVLVDANVLYSRTLRDWLFLLHHQSEGDLFRVCSTHDILAEVLYRYRRNNPTAPGRVVTAIHDRISDSLDEVVTDYDVPADYDGVDADDAHVHAATVASRSSILLTDDAGFAATAERDTDVLPYEVHTSDSFFVTVDDSQASVVRAVTLQQHDYWKGRDVSVRLDQSLRNAGCPRFAVRVVGHLVALRLRAA